MKHAKLTSILLAVCMVAGLLPWSLLPARADWAGSTVRFDNDPDTFLTEDSDSSTYTITYDLDGGEIFGEDNPETYTAQDEPITLNNPEKEGFEFAGWTGTGLSEATMEVTIPTGSEGDRSYKAVWVAVISDLTVGNAAVTHAGNIEGAGAIGFASVSADSRGVILTLSGFRYDGTEEADAAISAAIRYEGDAPLIIVLAGESSVKRSAAAHDSQKSYGVYSKYADLTIEGDGKLTASGAKVEKNDPSESKAAQSCGIYSGGSITIRESVRVTAVGGDVSSSYWASSYGAYANDALTVSSGSLIGQGGTVTALASFRDDVYAYSYGAYAYDALTVSGGELTAAGGNATTPLKKGGAYSYGACCSKGTLTVDGGKLTGTCGAVSSSYYACGYGVSAADELTVSGGELVGQAGEATSSYYAYSCGAWSKGTLTVDGGKLTCQGGTADSAAPDSYSYGIYTAAGLDVSGDATLHLTAAGESRAVSGTLTAPNGIVIAQTWADIAGAGEKTELRIGADGLTTDCKRIDISTSLEIPVFFKVSGSILNGALSAVVDSTSDSLLIAAVYDEEGWQISVKTFPITGSDTTQEVDAEMDVEDDQTCKLMLVD
ncbi:MAG: InlB B-repeat-containing protein, partial [Oscillospiraceae bacterium]|nr:InlB B-repeat-containing protein [Oscillospiraceae bacterium]